MTKHIIWLFIIALLSASLATAACVVLLSRHKLVYVDSARLLDEYKGMQAARQAYEKKEMQWKANVDTLTREIGQLVSHFRKENHRLTKKESDLSQELIRTRQNRLQEYTQALQVQAQQEQAKMTKEVLDRVNAYLKTYGQTHGYEIILAATTYGNLAYADEGLDITSDVLEGLNKGYKP